MDNLQTDAVSLKEHFEALLAAQDTRHRQDTAALREQIAALEALVDAKQKALAIAVEVQATTMEGRLVGMNEWRQTFGDLVNRAVSRDVFDNRSLEVNRRLLAIETKLALTDNIGPLVARHDTAISTLREWQARINGQFATWGIGLTVLATVIALVARFVKLGG
jgi:hypothetical protein